MWNFQGNIFIWTQTYRVCISVPLRTFTEHLYKPSLIVQYFNAQHVLRSVSSYVQWLWYFWSAIVYFNFLFFIFIFFLILVFVFDLVEVLFNFILITTFSVSFFIFLICFLFFLFFIFIFVLVLFLFLSF